MPTSQPLVWARAFYFCYFAAIGCYVPFINLYFQSIGLSGSAIGALAAMPPLILLVASPLWGALGDRFHVHRFLLPLATLGPVIPVLLMTRTESYSGLALLVLWAALFVAPIVPLIDSATLDLLAGTNQAYGQVRVWGSIGFTVATWVMGFVLNQASLTVLFYAYALMLSLAGLLAFGLPARRQSWQVSYRASLRAMLRQRSLALFLAGSFLIGATLQAAYSFYPLYLLSLGGNPAWVGLGSALSALTETPVVFFSGLLFRWVGVRGSVILSYAMFSLRWGILALARAPLPALLTNAMHGVTFAPFLVGSIAYVQQHTPPGLAATSQALYTAAAFGLGAAAGALGGGWLYDNLGPAGLFGVTSVTALVAMLCVALAGREKRLP
jgi:PPP family 3-phenylpropionic acid transporter